jgi:serine/threonine protein kinase
MQGMADETHKFDFALTVLKELLPGLGEIHRMEIAHCDLRPENILLTREGRVKIADWGCAVGSDESVKPAALVETTGLVEWPDREDMTYMAPELQVGAHVSIGECQAGDFWGTGMVFYELLTGQTTGDLSVIKHPGAHAVLERLLSRNPTDRVTAIDLIRTIQANGPFMGLTLGAWVDSEAGLKANAPLGDPTAARVTAEMQAARICRVAEMGTGALAMATLDSTEPSPATPDGSDPYGDADMGLY